jgi:hypothetical protein
MVGDAMLDKIDPNSESQPSWTGPIVAGVLLVVLGIGLVALNAMLRSGASAVKSNEAGGPTKAAQPAPSLPKPAAAALFKGVASKTVATQPPARPTQPAPTPQPAALAPSKSVPKQPVQPPAAPSSPVDAEKKGIFDRAVADARAALAARDMPTAETHIKTATANAQTPTDRDEIDRLESLLENLTQFWQGIGAAMAKFRPADEIALPDSRLIVVESRSDYLEVKSAGRKYQYRIETLPTPLVLAIVEQNFGKDPGSKAIIASFLAIDPQGDRALAKRYWQEAAAAGFDCEKLIQELDERGPVR